MEADERLRWIETHVTSSLKPQAEELKQLFENEDSRSTLFQFFSNEDRQLVFIYYTTIPGQVLHASFDAPENVKTKFLVFVRVDGSDKITRENINSSVFYLDWSENFLDHFEALTRHIFLPMLSVEQSGEACRDKIMDLLHRIMGATQVMSGKTKGLVTLASPSLEVLSEAASFGHRRLAVIHILETTLIGWIKQIKVALKLDIDSYLENHHGKSPQPFAEVEFWRDRASMINMINEQLCSPQIMNVLTALEDGGSIYAASFQAIKRDIDRAEKQVLDNLLFLDTLEKYFNKIDASWDLYEFSLCFKPMMHTLLLVWTYSGYYHMSVNVKRIIKMMSNQLVSKMKAIIGENVLENIESKRYLKESFQICAAFRGTYLDAKQQADAINKVKVNEQVQLKGDQAGVVWHSSIYRTARTQRGAGLFTKKKDGSTGEEDSYWEDSPWPNRTSKVFTILNSFMERCSDVIELVEVKYQFFKLKTATDGDGAGDMATIAQVREVQDVFNEATQVFNNNVKDVLDVGKHQKFESSFFHFRSVVRELEFQLGSIISECLQHCWDMQSKLRLLNVFEDITKREIVQNVLQKTLSSFIVDVKQQLTSTEQLFLNGVVNSKSHLHLPPVTNKLLWLHSLVARVENLMKMLGEVAPMCFKGEEGWELKDLYYKICNNIEREEKNVVTDWLKSFSIEILDKLKEPLLIHGLSTVEVNLDDNLLRCLREIYYLSSSPFNVKLPEEIMHRVKHIDVTAIRAHSVRLNTAIAQYHLILKDLKNIERPLVHEKLSKAEKLLNQGIDDLTWNDARLPDYVEDINHLLCNDLFRTIQCIQENLDSITDIVDSWTSRVIELQSVEQQVRPYRVEELNANYLCACEDINTKILAGDKKIRMLLDKIFETLQVSKSSPQWMAYLNYVNKLVSDGLQQSVIESLQYIFNRMVVKSLQNESTVLPILQLDIHLIGSIIYFSPPMEETFATPSLQEYVKKWLAGILIRMDLIKISDQEMSETNLHNKEIEALLNHIKQMVDESTAECKKLSSIFRDYAFLWTQDANYTFKEFLNGNISNRPRLLSRAEGIRSRASAISASKSRDEFRDNSSEKSSAVAVSAITTGMMGLGEKTFLKIKDPDGKPNLDDFDREIGIFQRARQELASAQVTHDLSWIRVNLQPIIQTIETYSSKWMYCYTKYLTDQVRETLVSLDVFLKRIEPGIEAITGEEKDIFSFMKLMRLFNKVSKQQVELDSKFIAMKRAIQLLEKYDQKLSEKTRQFYTAAPIRWNNLKMKVSLVKQQVGPKIQSEENSVVKVLVEFKDQCLNIQFEMENSQMHSRDIEVSSAYTLIDQFQKEIGDLETEAQELMELQELLEKEVVDFSIINKLIKDQQNEWKRHPWQKIRTRLLKRGLDAQYELVRKLPDKSHGWDVTLSLNEMIKEMISCIPVMDELGKASLRPRHWKQLVRLTAVVGNLTNDDLAKMNLKQLIQLGLHNADEVRAVVAKASKDISVENALKLYEEIWLSKVFKVKRHSRLIPCDPSMTNQDDFLCGSENAGGESEFGIPTAVHTLSTKINQSSQLYSTTSMAQTISDHPVKFLVKNVQSILEELHEHQVSLQIMLNSSSATSFIDDITKWRKSLQQIESFINILIDAQEKWIQLDDIYSSPEMKNSCPRESDMFALSSLDFANIMNSIEKNPNVLQIVSKSNILQTLEKVNLMLTHCQKVVTQHLEKRRHKNPRLLLLSVQEACSILCKGYDPNLLSPYFYKLFQNIDSVEACISNDGLLYHITGFYSLLGEYVTLPKPVVCENGVENWLLSFHKSVRQCNQLNLACLMNVELTDQLQALCEGDKNKNPISSVTKIQSELRSSNNQRQPCSASTGEDHALKGSKSDVFTYLFCTLLPLPEKWSFDECSDGIQLSVKVTVSNLVQHYYDLYASGNDSSLKTCCEKLNSVIVFLSDFLMAQTKIKLHKKNLAKRNVMVAEVLNLENLDISLSQNNIPITGDKMSSVEVSGKQVSYMNLKRFQIQIITNLMQYLSNERNFVKNLVNVTSLGYDVRTQTPFDWSIHPIYRYAEDSCTIDVAIGDTSWDYDFEFQGSSNFLVTPENEKTLYWLASGVKQFQGGFFITHQAEGSDELVRMLACVTGRSLFSYVCTSDVGSNTVGDMFEGAIRSGSWLCFKNMENLSPASLSMLSMYMSAIFTAFVKKQSSVFINQDEILMNSSTMAFGYSSYKNYVQLPVDVSKHFRIVSYTPPDATKVLEVGLMKSGMILSKTLVSNVATFLHIIQRVFPCYSSGFGKHRLQSLIGCFYKCYIESLAYKYGQKIPREISSVTEVVGNEDNVVFGNEVDDVNIKNFIDVKDEKVHVENDTGDTPENKEEIERNIQCNSILLALHQSFTPALSSQDIVLFENVLNDMFPDADVHVLLDDNIKQKQFYAATVKLYMDGEDRKEEKEKSDVDPIYKSIEILSRMKGWSQLLTKKVEQLAEMISCSRMVTISSLNDHLVHQCVSSFLDANEKSKVGVKTDIISPLALLPGQLFGQFNTVTRQWSDGILPTMISTASKDASKVHFMIIDGEMRIDESILFQDILVGREYLVLQNGSRLKIPDNMKFIWQIGRFIKGSQLSEISSTTSLIWINTEKDAWRHLLKSWFHKMSPETQSHLYQLFFNYVTETVKYFEHDTDLQNEEEMNLTLYRIVKTMLNIFDSIGGHVQISSDYHNYANYAVFWAFNVTLPSFKRPSFAVWWRDAWRMEVIHPDQEELSNFVVNSDSHLFINLKDCCYFANKTQPSIFCHTDNNMATLYLMNCLIHSSTSVALCAPAGCGKTVLLQDELLKQKSDENDFSVLVINYNKFLTSDSLWERLNEVLEWKHSCYYQPLGSKKLVCLVEDISQCQEDACDSIPVCELIYQLIKHGGAYNPEKQKWQQLGDTTFIVTSSQDIPGECHPSTKKLIQSIPQINMLYPSIEDREKIFISMLCSHFISMEDRQLLTVKDNLINADKMKRKIHASLLMELLIKLVGCTVELQENLKSMFLRIPERFHYVFNLNTLARIFRSLCVCVPVGSTHDTIMKTWSRELHWAYTQSLRDEVDEDRWRKIIKIVLKKRMDRQQLDVIEGDIPVFTNLNITKLSSNQSARISFGAWQNNYSMQKLQNVLHINMMNYNKENPKIKLQHYEQTTDVIFRLLQIVQAPFTIGHSLIVSEGFPGLVPVMVKQVCYLSDVNLVTINESEIVLEEKYSVDKFKNDMVQIFINCGIKNERCVLLVTQLDIFDEAVIILLKEFLQLGTMSHIFSQEEKLTVVNSVRTSGEKEMAHLSATDAWDVFIRSVREHLHIIITLSAMDGDFQKIAFHHPDLISSMSVIYMKHWSKQDLVNCAQFLLKDLSCMIGREKERLAHLFVSLHLTLQQEDPSAKFCGTYGNITNTTFELMVERFCLLYAENKSNVEKKKRRIKQTLKTAQSSFEMILEMKKKLEHEKQVLVQKQLGSDTLLTQIGQDRAITEQQVRLVEKTRQKINKLAKLLPEYEEAHKRAVFKAAAVVKETKNVLNRLDDKGLSDLRSLQKPDSELEDLLVAVIIIVKSPSSDLTWNRGAKRIMANLERFKEELSVFDESELPEATLQMLKTYTSRPHLAPGYLESKTHNSAVASLVLYVRGVVRYNYMMQSRVKPLHTKKNETSKRLREVKKKISTMEEKLEDLRKRLKTLAVKFEEASVQKSRQHEKVENLTRLLENAADFEAILSKLMSNWKTDLSSIEIAESALPNEIALGVAFSVYMGPYKYSFRKHMLMKAWWKCLTDQGVKMVGIRQNGLLHCSSNEILMKSDVEFSSDQPPSYHNCIQVLMKYLLGEELCRHLVTSNINAHDIENLAIIKSPIDRALFVVDPLNRLNGLLLQIKHEMHDVVELDVQHRDNNFIGTIERAVSRGSLLVIKNIDEAIDHVLHPLIYSISSDMKNGNKIIKFNGHRIQYHPDFKLILSSCSYKPQVPIEFASLCTLVNFAPNPNSFQSEIKRKMFLSLRPNVLKYKQKLLYEAFTCMRQKDALDVVIMQEIEDKAGSQELCTDTSNLTMLSERRNAFSKTLQNINSAYRYLMEYYKHNNHVSKPVVLLFKILHSLNLMEKHYCFPYAEFSSMFEDCFPQPEEFTMSKSYIYKVKSSVECNLGDLKYEAQELTEINEQDITSILQILTAKFLKLLKRSLSPSDYEVFCMIHMIYNKRYDGEHADSNFIQVLFAIDDAKFGSKKCSTRINKPDWLPEERFNILMNMLKDYPALENVLEMLQTQPSLVKYWYDKPCPEEAMLPHDAGSTLPYLNILRLLTVKALRPDRFYFALKTWMCTYNNDVLSLQNNDANDILESLNRRRPILILEDTDQVTAVEIVKRFSLHKGVQLKHVSVCGELDESVDNALTSIVQDDAYLIIKDLHLAHADLVTKLYNRLKRLGVQQQTCQWRVFLVTKNCANLKEPMLRFCHVLSLSAVTNEPACLDQNWSTLLQRNVIHSLQTIDDDIWMKLQDKSSQIKTLVFTMCMFHAYISSYFHRSLVIVVDQQLRDAVQWTIGQVEVRKVDNFLLDELIRMLCQDVYGAKVIRNESLRNFATDIIYKSTFAQQSEIVIGDFKIPVPPADIEPKRYAQWVKGRFSEKKETVADQLGTKLSFFHNVNTRRAGEFLTKIRNVMASIDDGYKISNDENTINMIALHDNIRMCKESMPNLIDMTIRHYEDSQLELMREVIVKECQVLNDKLLAMRNCLIVLENNICGGVLAIADAHGSEAEMLSCGSVPSQWLEEHRKDLNTPLKEWLRELRFSAVHLSDVRHDVSAYFSTKPQTMKRINLKSLSNVEALLTAMKYKKFVKSSTAEEICFNCRFVDPSNDYFVDWESIGSSSFVMVTDCLYIQGASIIIRDSSCCVDEYRNTVEDIQKMPLVYIWPDVKQDSDNELVLPVYVDKTRKKLLFHLPVPIKETEIRWLYTNPAILLKS